MQLRLERRASPLGTMLLVTDDNGALRALDFEDHEDRMRQLLRLHYGTVELMAGTAPMPVTDAINAYFEGEWQSLSGIPIETNGTAFQRSVWRALLDIPPGTTMGYGELAAQLGKPGASRAVGLANGANPVAIAVPCHRVIGKSGALTGYGGGVWRKQWLLTHEGAYPGSLL